MPLVVENAFPGARLVDSLPFSNGGTEAQAKALAASGVEGFIGYLGAMNPARLGYILDAGLAFMPVTFAGEYEDGAADEVAQLKALDVPAGVTVWLDLEGLKAFRSDVTLLANKINTWAAAIVAGGWVAGLYVGAPQPFTGPELYRLGVTRYWLGQGRCMGRDGLDAYPKCGWCMRQDWHNTGTGFMWKSTGILVDTNAVQADHFGRLPTWLRRVP